MKPSRCRPRLHLGTAAAPRPRPRLRAPRAARLRRAAQSPTRHRAPPRRRRTRVVTPSGPRAFTTAPRPRGSNPASPPRSATNHHHAVPGTAASQPTRPPSNPDERLLTKPRLLRSPARRTAPPRPFTPPCQHVRAVRSPGGRRRLGWSPPGLLPTPQQKQKSVFTQQTRPRCSPTAWCLPQRSTASASRPPSRSANASPTPPSTLSSAATPTMLLHRHHGGASPSSVSLRRVRVDENGLHGLVGGLRPRHRAHARPLQPRRTASLTSEACSQSPSLSSPPTSPGTPPAPRSYPALSCRRCKPLAFIRRRASSLGTRAGPAAAGYLSTASASFRRAHGGALPLLEAYLASRSVRVARRFHLLPHPHQVFDAVLHSSPFD